MVVEQTSMPLSSNIPGVTVVHQRPTSGLIDVESLVNLPPKKRHQRRRHGGDDNSNNNYNSNKRRLASNADVVMSDGKSAAVAELPDIVVSRLVIDSRFYHVLRYGDNKFACKAHTLTGRRASGFFIIRKV
jgi:hypothetical protein